jgi:GNAT superfamily N-acetyltransferase
MPAPDEITLTPVAEGDFEALLALRMEAMRPSLERLGRCDPARARERSAASFAPAHTRHVCVAGRRVGFVAVRPADGRLLLDHFYLRPDAQGRGVGPAILARVFAEADAAGLPAPRRCAPGQPGERLLRAARVREGGRGGVGRLLHVAAAPLTLPADFPDTPFPSPAAEPGA